jgi:TPR repeat protein
MGRLSFASVVLVGVAAIAAIAGCSSETGGAAGMHAVATPLTGESACVAPLAIINTTSPFEQALAAYANEGATPVVIKDLDSACRGTESNACLLLAVLYQAGEGTVQRDEAKAAMYRASLSDLTSSINLGMDNEAELFADQGIAIRISSSYCRIGRACRPGCEASCETAATRLRERVSETLLRACDRGGRKTACYLAAHVVEWGGSVDYVGTIAPLGDKAQALALLDKACNDGVGEACAQSAHSALNMKDEEEIAKKLTRACDLGIPLACLERGDLARKAHDQATAESAYTKSCELGMRSACSDLARMFETGSYATFRDQQREDADPWPRDDSKSARFRLLADISNARH